MELAFSDQQLLYCNPEFSEIHLARVDEHPCLTGGGKRYQIISGLMLIGTHYHGDGDGLRAFLVDIF